MQVIKSTLVTVLWYKMFFNGGINKHFVRNDPPHRFHLLVCGLLNDFFFIIIITVSSFLAAHICSGIDKYLFWLYVIEKTCKKHKQISKSTRLKYATKITFKCSCNFGVHFFLSKNLNPTSTSNYGSAEKTMKKELSFLFYQLYPTDVYGSVVDVYSTTISHFYLT